MLMLMRNDGVFSADGAHTSALGVSFYGGSGVCPTRKFGKLNLSKAALIAF